MNDNGLLLDGEIKAILRSVLSSRQERGASEFELQCVLEWANKVRIDSALLDSILEGRIRIDWKDDDVVFFPV